MRRTQYDRLSEQHEMYQWTPTGDGPMAHEEEEELREA